ncbi:MAG: helix-turn-helix transcriptional regulator [Nitrospirae bacterium]|nr:helix-turn-helix transcriptional regulator [Nitrospirota bacterium]
MSERSKRISRLLTDQNSRFSYVRAKLGILVPSQIRAVRLKSDLPRQADLAREAGMLQSRISMLETPGAANVTLDTLARLAAVFKVGLLVKFVPYSEMLQWENTFSQDSFDVVRLDRDAAFLRPELAAVAGTRSVRELLGATDSSADNPPPVIETERTQSSIFEFAEHTNTPLASQLTH